MVTMITALTIVVQMVEKSCGEDKMLVVWRGKRCVEKEEAKRDVKICTRQKKWNRIGRVGNARLSQYLPQLILTDPATNPLQHFC